MKYKILLVDDDENILAGYRRRLRSEFNIHTSTSAIEGLEKLSSKDPFAIVVSDLKMPEMDGFDFLSKVHEKSPETVCIMLTGFAELQASLKAFNEDYIFRFLTKPCKIEVLQKSIREGIEKYLKQITHQQESSKTDIKANNKRILIVDDDKDNLPLLSSAFSSKEKIEVLTAENIDIALKLIGIIKFNLIIIDSIFLIDDTSFLKRIREKFQDINIAVTTWLKTDKLRKKLKPFKINKYFEKPLDLNILYDTILEEFYSGPKGVIDGISISSFLQMIEMEEKTCTLTINTGENTGHMYFRKGSLLNAKTKDLKGENAAYTIINWQKAAIEIDNYCKKNEKLINQPLMSILMEAARIYDHKMAE